MEKEILEILKSIQLDIKGLKDEVKDLKEGQKIIEKKLDGVVEQTAELLEFRTTVKTKLDELTLSVTLYNEYSMKKEGIEGFIEKTDIHHTNFVYDFDEETGKGIGLSKTEREGNIL